MPEDSVHERITRVREMTLAAFAHQDMPLERLVEALNPVRDQSRSPLFQVMFMVQNNDMGTLALEGMEITPWPANEQAAKFDITWSLTPLVTGLNLEITYNKDLFDGVIIEALARHYLQLLTGFAAVPDSRVRDLSMLSDAERATALQPTQ